MGYEPHVQPQNMPVQICSALQVVVHPSTASECLTFANTRASETEGVTTQIANTAMTDSTTGYCVYNSGGSGTWQLLTTSIDTVVCDTPGSLCACKPRDDYVTLGTDAAISSVALSYDTDPNGAVYTRQTCCQLCSGMAPPSTPPLPPRRRADRLRRPTRQASRRLRRTRCCRRAPRPRTRAAPRSASTCTTRARASSSTTTACAI